MSKKLFDDMKAAASIGILMDDLHRAEKFEEGDRLLIVAAESSSWSYGGMLVTWSADR